MESNLAPIQGGVSQAVLDQLAGTKGWTRLFSVLLWISASFMILAGIMMVFLGGIGGMAGATDNPMAPLGGIVGGVVIGAIYLVMAFFYIYPALKLGKYASRINDLLANPSDSVLAAALNEQRAFWKYCGIMVIVFMAIYLVAIIGFVVVAGAGAAAAIGGSGEVLDALENL